MLQLLNSKNLWSQVVKVRGEKPVVAAISYVNKDHLKLRAGDILICDASDSRIATGATTYALLSLLAKRKVALWHLDKLHAKVVRLSAHVVVGSANMTANSESLIESAVLTDQTDAFRQVDEMLSSLLNSGKLKRIDGSFLSRIKSIPVMYSGSGGERAARNLDYRKPTCWLMGYQELSPREQEKSDKEVAIKTNRDEAPAYFRITLNAAKKRAPIYLGDNLVFVHLREKRVRRSVTVTGVVQTEKHLFYIHEDIADGGRTWASVQKRLQTSGVCMRSGIPAQLALDQVGVDIINGMLGPNEFE